LAVNSADSVFISRLYIYEVAR